jgi:endonuclease III
MNKANIELFFSTLAQANPSPQTELVYTSVFELLTAVLLSAQATDVGVNKATAKLFPRANTPQAIVDMGLPALEDAIKTIGLYKSKARHLMQACELLLRDHNSVVPNNREALEALPDNPPWRSTHTSSGWATALAWHQGRMWPTSNKACSNAYHPTTWWMRTTG